MQDKLVCTSCEKVTDAHMNFSEAGKITFVVCFECLGTAIRWLVRKAREEEAKLKEMES